MPPFQDVPAQRASRTWNGKGESALDVPLQRTGDNGSPVTLRSVWASLRARGVTPHPIGEARDAEMAEIFVDILARRSTSGRTEATVIPDSRVGVAEGEWPRNAPVTQAGRDGVGPTSKFQSATIEKFGTALQQAADLAAMGAGRARRLKQSDITWSCLFPVDELLGDFYEYGDEVPSPADIFQNLLVSPELEPFGRLAGVTALITLGWFLGVKFDLNPFSGGGGITTNYLPGSSDQQDRDFIPYAYEFVSVDGEITESDLTDGDRYASITAGKPAWQYGVLIPSGHGWSSFYHDLDPHAFPSRNLATEQGYQKYGLNVWPTEATALAPTSVYAQEVARRKSLAVAAFSAGIAEWLRYLDLAMADDGRALSDVVDRIELGNELDGFWETSRRTVTWGASVREVGRLLALIAGPIHVVHPWMRFRTELHSWGVQSGGPHHDTFREKLNWIEGVLIKGMTTEVYWWDRARQYQLQADWHALGLGHPKPTYDQAVEEWYATCAAAGFTWPPPIYDAVGPPPGSLIELSSRYSLALRLYRPILAPELIHQVGWHFYHGNNTAANGDPGIFVGYADHNRLIADAQQTIGLGSASGFTIGATFGEIGYHAHDPGEPDKGTSWDGAYYAGASPKLQAAMLTRAVLAAVAAGADTASAYPFTFGALPSSSPFTEGYTFANWQIFSTMGVHNDVADPDRDYAQASDCWRRPSWYALRRLSWLLGAASSVGLCHQTRGLTVVQLDFPAGLAAGPEGEALTDAWTRAFVVWLDQYANNEVLHPPAGPDLGHAIAHLTLLDPGGTGSELLPLVPDVVPQATAGCGDGTQWCVDENGFAAISAAEADQPNPDWRWEGWSNALASVDAHPSGAGSVLRYTILKVNPLGSPVVIAPLCILTHATFQGVLS